jgi:XTP/dITP diphosphohydrolase
MKLLLATRNKDKIKEIKAILKDLDIEIISAGDVPDLPEVIEDKDTIAANAIKKAVECAAFSGFFALADDTGLFVSALAGEPGVFSSRYAGENCSYSDNRQKLLEEMKGKIDRKAEFRTVAAFASPKGLISTAEGVVAGEITFEEIGSDGFGYDPIFRAEETGKTFGEMSLHYKEAISHRGRAIRKIVQKINEYKINQETDDGKS